MTVVNIQDCLFSLELPTVAQFVKWAIPKTSLHMQGEPK